jgi:hypothetical protein
MLHDLKPFFECHSKMEKNDQTLYCGRFSFDLKKYQVIRSSSGLKNLLIVSSKGFSKTAISDTLKKQQLHLIKFILLLIHFGFQNPQFELAVRVKAIGKGTLSHFLY